MENNEKIQKPTSVLKVEFEQALIELINQSNLPVFIIEPILKDLYQEAVQASKKEYEAEMKMYEQALTATNKN